MSDGFKDSCLIKMKAQYSRSGDYLLDKYFPNADSETRELAREAFGRYAEILERLGEKILRHQRLIASGAIPEPVAPKPVRRQRNNSGPRTLTIVLPQGKLRITTGTDGEVLDKHFEANTG